MKLNLLAVFFIIFIQNFETESNLSELIEAKNNYNLNKDFAIFNSDSYSVQILKNELHFFKTGQNYKSKITINPKSRLDSVFYYLNKGNKLFYNSFDQSKDAATFYVKSIELSKKTNNKHLICHTIRSLLLYQLWFSYSDTFDSKSFFELYKKNIYSQEQQVIYDFFLLLFKTKKEKYLNLKIAHQNLEKLPPYYKSWWYNSMGVSHYLNKNNVQSDLFFSKSLDVINNHKGFIYELKRTSIYQNLARIASEKKEKNKVIFYLNKSIGNKNYNNKLFLQSKTYYLNRMVKLYQGQKKWDSAFYYLDSFNKLKSKLNQQKIILKVEELNTKYQTAEKDKKILESEVKRKQNAYLFYGTLAFLFLGGTIAYLTLKNSHKKRQLAEQQKELEIQKNLALIKDQEITSINAMVEGQEKERKRIAEDLHDNIGSVLATLKLHFENLKLNRKKKQFNQEELYEKTENLIDETYLKVRSIAHAKNAGVIANQGLLVAIQIMAEKISSANKTKIEVIHFGLNKRLENSIELSVFRIVQELTTNIIKHAEATKATINISQFNGDLNIIIEDNGKGFDINKIEFKNGMGLNSIKTRVEYLQGTFEIDSTIKKGTTIIINIPTENT